MLGGFWLRLVACLKFFREIKESLSILSLRLAKGGNIAGFIRGVTRY